MREWCVTLVIWLWFLVPVGADVTIIRAITWPTVTTSQSSPTSTMRIKGMRARSDMEVDGRTIVAITDLEQKQVILLDSATKTARVVTAESAAAGAGGVTLPNIVVSFQSTGKSQVLEGMQCDEQSFTLTMSMAEMGGQAQVPAEAAAMMKDMKMVMNGSVWVAKDAPGAAEFMAFNKAALASQLLPAVSGLVEMKPGQWGGLDKLMAVSASAPGLPNLTEASITLTFEASGKTAKQMGPMKINLKVVSVSTDALSEDLFKVPDGYTINK